MPNIHLQTLISADIETCFDLSRSNDLHLESTRQTGETAIAGRTSGLIQFGETVTWRARHFGIWQTLTSKITVMQKPDLFVDEMVDGAFSSNRHEHHFAQACVATLMTDIFTFEAPLGWLGDIACKLFLTRYMTNLLTQRNEVIKNHAEVTNNHNETS
jgi:ligand-binding SRPBCC domain-containing protein